MLLCNLLLGFGLDTYICVGTNSEGSHAWVLTRAPATTPDGSKRRVQFWESLTGSKFDQEDPRVQRFYRTVDCIFNNKCFYANIQADNRVANTNWNLEDEFMWKGMSQSYVNMLPPTHGVGFLQPSTLFSGSS